MCSVSSEPSHNSSRHIMVKAKIFIGTEPKCTKSSKQSSAIKVFRNSAPCHKDVHWLHCRCYMVDQRLCNVISKLRNLKSSEAFISLRTYQRY